MLKIILLLTTALAFLHVWQEEEKKRDLEADREEIVNLEHETARAMQLNNATFFKRVYSEDFIATSAPGLVMDKSTFVNSVQYPEVKFDSFIASDIRVRFYQDTAVVNCLWTERGKLRGQTFSNQSRILHVYINGPRGWQAVASQETPLPGAGR